MCPLPLIHQLWLQSALHVDCPTTQDWLKSTATQQSGREGMRRRHRRHLTTWSANFVGILSCYLSLSFCNKTKIRMGIFWLSYFLKIGRQAHCLLKAWFCIRLFWYWFPPQDGGLWYRDLVGQDRKAKSCPPVASSERLSGAIFVMKHVSMGVPVVNPGNIPLNMKRVICHKTEY